jgi:hypothetical protein
VFIERGLLSLLSLLRPENLGFVFRTIGSSLIVFAFGIMFRPMAYYTSMIPGFLGEFVPLIINLFVLIFLIGCFPGSVKVTRMQSLAILFGIFVFLAAKAPAPDDDFGPQGGADQCFNSSNHSIVLFAPAGGRPLLKSIASRLRNGSDIVDCKFDRPLGEVAYAVRWLNSSLVSFVAKWPHFEVTSNIGEVSRTVGLIVLEINPGLSHLGLMVGCGRRKCVTGVRRFEEVRNFEKRNKNGFRHMMRVMQAVERLEMEFNITAVGPVAAKVYFTWD